MIRRQSFKVLADPAGSRFDNCASKARVEVVVDEAGGKAVVSVYVKGKCYTMPLAEMLDSVHTDRQKEIEGGRSHFKVLGRFGDRDRATVTFIEDGKQGQVRVRPHRAHEDRACTIAALCHTVVLRHAEHTLGCSFRPRRLPRAD